MFVKSCLYVAIALFIACNSVVAELKLFNATDLNFRDLIQGHKGLWLIDFHAPWCRYCVLLNPTLIEIAEKLGERLYIAKVDVTNEEILAEEYGIKILPTLFYTRNGNLELQAYKGNRSADDFYAFVEYMEAHANESNIDTRDLWPEESSSFSMGIIGLLKAIFQDIRSWFVKSK